MFTDTERNAYFVTTNFEFLTSHNPLLGQLAVAAETAFSADPNTTLIKLRQLGEAIAQEIATRLGVGFDDRTTQIDLLREIQYSSNIDREVLDSFHAIRKIGNTATHEFVSTHREAMLTLKLAWRTSIWYHRTFGNPPKGWKPEPFQPPRDPSEKVRALEEQIAELERARQQARADAESAQEIAEKERLRAQELEQYNSEIADEVETWQTIAQEQEDNLVAARKEFDAEIQELTSSSQGPSGMEFIAETRATLNASPWEESEAETRFRIDQQLRDAGWIADTENIRFALGARPEPGLNKAIAEWPTESGPADYVLFCGMTAIATVEAKKASRSVASDIDQAERYSQTIQQSELYELSGEWSVDPLNAASATYKIPFAFATNGRPYIEQHRELSGVWFRDLRRPQNLRRAMDGWYSPTGLTELLKLDLDKAEESLKEQPFAFDFPLRHYQRDAIEAIESAISNGQQNLLVAMATGTGKTKTCIALIYRLLKAQRFRRILFVVDRNALGKQALDNFETTQIINHQTFDDIFNIAGLDMASPDDSTEVHVATIQGMVHRIIYSDDNKPTVDDYDCIVIDECHRGYLLDREMSDSEITFRSQSDYISKYRSVVEYFDAIKVGLTATPALHTTQIFGDPVYSYSYREAVIDGYLIDHDPPVQIKTEFNQNGLKYAGGEDIQVFDGESVDLIHLEDELEFNLSQLNKDVEVEDFNRTVCKALVDHIDPFSDEKTLIFCVTNNHADLVVRVLKEVIEETYGECEDDLVKKITGTSDRPIDAIRHYRNDRKPNIAVTVDLLTTGVDIPKICNLVFLRPIKSRILYEQMMGRATRRCDEIGKEVFRIFDAVSLYENLDPLSSMKPVVVNPNVSYTTLLNEIIESRASEDVRNEAKNQLIAKMQRSRQRMDRIKEDFETSIGMSPEQFIDQIKELSISEVTEWITNNPTLGEILDSKAKSKPPVIFISDKEDTLIDVSPNYGVTITPEDYIAEFEKFVQENENKILALSTLIHQPGKITRQQVKELLLTLDQEQFSERNLRSAYGKQNKQDIAARIVGYVRQAALGDALLPWEDRVDNAVTELVASREWKPAQKTLLGEIGVLLKTRLALDEQSINESALTNKYGRYERINKMFDEKLPEVLEDLNTTIWSDAESA